MGLLLRSVVDRKVEKVLKRGRFSLSREEVLNERHFLRVIEREQEKMIDGLQRQGFTYISSKNNFWIEGPLDHIDFLTDSIPDQGPLDRPHPRDLEGQIKFELSERSKVAKAAETHEYLVDFRIWAYFTHLADIQHGQMGGNSALGKGQLWTPPLH